MKSITYDKAVAYLVSGPVILVALVILGVSKSDYSHLYFGAVLLHVFGLVYMCINALERSKKNMPASSKLMVIAAVGMFINIIFSRL